MAKKMMSKGKTKMKSSYMGAKAKGKKMMMKKKK